MRILFLVSLLALQGCLVTRGDVKETEQRQQMVQQVSTLQKTSADVNNKFSEIDEELRSHNGRLEVMENKLSVSGRELEQEKKSMADQNAELSRKVSLLQDTLVKMEEQLNLLSAEVARQADRPMAAKAGIKTANAALTTKKTGYDTAEEFFIRREWKKAILNYEKYRQEFPKGKNVPDATYKIGVAFQELKMKDEARTFYEEVVEKYPKSDEARRSRTRLKSLK
jgi:TolA-binding protein